MDVGQREHKDIAEASQYSRVQLMSRLIAVWPHVPPVSGPSAQQGYRGQQAQYPPL